MSYANCTYELHSIYLEKGKLYNDNNNNIHKCYDTNEANKDCDTSFLPLDSSRLTTLSCFYPFFSLEYDIWKQHVADFIIQSCLIRSPRSEKYLL